MPRHRALVVLGSSFVTLTTISCASVQRAPQVELPKLPMGMGQAAIDAVTNDPDDEAALRVSPDGRFLLFNIVTTTKRPARSFIDSFRSQVNGEERLLSFYQQNAISLIEIGKPGRTIVSQEGAGDPGWFPDSKSFVFSMLQGKQAMLATSTVGTGTAAVKFVSPTPCVAYDKSPAVSPSGQTILFSTVTATEPGTIATMEVKSSESKCKILFPGESPQWAPSGRKFSFTRVVGGHNQVFTFDDAKNALTQITFGGFDNFEPAWSPDGRSIVFVTNRTGTPHIFTIAEDGSNLVQITQGPTSDRYPTWSRDGSIYFVSNAGGQQDIWRAKVQGR